VEPLSPRMRERLDRALKTYEATLLEKLVRTYGLRAVMKSFAAHTSDIEQATIPVARLQLILASERKARPMKILTLFHSFLSLNYSLFGRADFTP
jgi:hypothetical protein